MTNNPKTDSKNLHPMENASFELYKVLSPLMRKMHLTPNLLTTFSIVFSFICAYFIYKGKYVLSTLFILLSYIFDVFDGAFAREYKMYSPFGKIYDHYSDIIMALVVLGVFYKYNPLRDKTKIGVFAVIAFLLIMTYVSQGCLSRVLEEEEAQDKKKEEIESVGEITEIKENPEKNQNKQNKQNKNVSTMVSRTLAFNAAEIVDVAEKLHDKTFDDTKKFCVGNSSNMIQITKYFGGETYTLYMCAVFLAIHFKILK